MKLNFARVSCGVLRNPYTCIFMKMNIYLLVRPGRFVICAVNYGTPEFLQIFPEWKSDWHWEGNISGRPGIMRGKKHHLKITMKVALCGCVCVCGKRTKTRFLFIKTSPPDTGLVRFQAENSNLNYVALGTTIHQTCEALGTPGSTTNTCYLWLNRMWTKYGISGVSWGRQSLFFFSVCVL